jgi:hypothetical protein
MHKITFFPTGNADTCFIQLANGKKIIYDYANTKDLNNKDDRKIDLEKAIRDLVGKKKEVDVFAISHLDKDHYKGASELFWLEHASKYQSEERIKIKTLWVPASAILEEGITTEGKILRAEARYRLENGQGIRVFSYPDALEAWMKSKGINPEDRKHLITNAGDLAKEFSLDHDGVEFFVHSPFAERCEDGSLVIRNDSALFMQATFEVEGEKTRLILSADCHYELLEGIIRVTKAHHNEERLKWDINNIPHHCSYLSLAEEKGTQKTVPSDDIKWLYEQQGNERSLLISTSDVIPDGDTIQPPHKQAAAYYKDVATHLKGEFLVTMEEPIKNDPEPITIEITRSGCKQQKAAYAPAITFTSTHTPRAGWKSEN